MDILFLHLLDVFVHFSVLFFDLLLTHFRFLLFFLLSSDTSPFVFESLQLLLVRPALRLDELLAFLSLRDEVLLHVSLISLFVDLCLPELEIVHKQLYFTRGVVVWLTYHL